MKTGYNEACGLPPNTIRAILAIMTCLFVYSVESFLIIILALNEKYDLALAVGGSLLVEAGAVTGWYFGAEKSRKFVKNNIVTNSEMVDSVRKEIELENIRIAEGV